MSQLEDRLNAVLSDPAELQRLTQMASQLMGNLNAGEAAPPPAETPPAQETPASSGFDLSAIASALGPMLQKLNPGKRSPLVDALAPYLDAARREKLERSMRIAGAARLAGGALRGLGGGGHGL